MVAFSYEARRPSGDVVSGSEEAADRAALKEKLARNGLLLVSARRVRGGAGPRLRSTRVRLPSMIAFLRELRHLVEAGLPVARALSMLKDRPDDRVLSAAVATLLAGVERGLPLDKAAAERPDVFDELVRATLAAGVRTSRLGEALAQLERFLVMRAELQSKVQRAMAYPLFLLGLLAVVLAGLMLFVLPRFAELYAEFGSDLPVSTRILMAMVEAAPIWIPAAAGGVLAAVYLWRRAMRDERNRYWRDRWILAMPVIGEIARDTAHAQAAYILSMLLRAGAPVREALEFVSESVANRVLRARFEQAGADVEKGRSLSAALADAALFPQTSLGMIRAGEGSGALPQLLDAVAKLHEQAVENRIGKLLALVEPAMILVVGIVLGAVIITVYLPVFGISGVVN